MGQPPNNNHTQFTYTYRHQLQQTTFPSGYFETYTFDTNDNLRFKTDRNGHQISYTYDFQNRLAIKQYPDYTTVNYTYDAAGRLTQVADPTGTYSFGYDNMGRLTSATSNYASTTFGNEMVQYAYDKASNRTSLTDPQNLVPTAYAYDKLNRLASITLNNDPSPDFTFAYDALSRRTSLTRANAITTTYAYNPQSWLTSVLHKNSAGTILDGAAYTYDNAGNRKTRTDKRLGTTLTYGYDNIYQLLTAKQGTTTKESYTYDIVGNRLSSLGVAPYTYNSSNELTSLPSGSYTYDKNGNTTVKPDGTQYTWDYENRLTQVVLPSSGGTANFKYDPFGRRIQKSFTQGSTTTTTNYLYDGTNLLEEIDPSGNVLARYTQGPSIDQPLTELRSGTTSYYEQDGLSSTTSLSNSAASLVNTYTYDSYGKLTASTGTLTNPFQYTGREFDSETGVNFYRARYYDPALGRFLNEDPIRFESGVNFYAYVSNNPATFIDPSGLLAQLYCEPISISGRPLRQEAVLLVSGAQHCFLRIACKGKDQTFELEGPRPGSTTGHPQIHNFDPKSRLGRGWPIPITPPPGSKCCEFEDRLQQVYEQMIQNLPTYNGYPGPNSNTFIYQLIRSAGGSVHMPPDAFGWDWKPTAR